MKPEKNLVEHATWSASRLGPDLQHIIEARHHDPFAALGRHTHDGEHRVTAFLPGASEVAIVDGNLDLHLFGEGKHEHVYRILGAYTWAVDGVTGVLFATWAPHAERVSVVGDFNDWDGRHHPLRLRDSGGIWELFIPQLSAGTIYKFEIRNRTTGTIQVKADPYGRCFEVPPGTASVVVGDPHHGWRDDRWMSERRTWDWHHAPMSVYEVHPGSWQPPEGGTELGYRALAERLVPYMTALGFTHIELLPSTEHSLDASWGDLLTQARPWMGRPHSLNITVPPLGGVVFKPVADS